MPQLQINQGPQDALLYDNSKSYFTNVGYTRTSNFQMELRDVDPQNSADFGSTVQFVIPKAADLLGPVDLTVDLVPTAAGDNSMASWVESVGFALIDKVTFSVGSHDIETITGDQLNIINELMRPDDVRLGVHTILKTARSATRWKPSDATTSGYLGHGADSPAAEVERVIWNEGDLGAKKSLIVPLGLFFTKHPSQYFPLAAIAGCNDVRISIKFRQKNELIQVRNKFDNVVGSKLTSSSVGVPDTTPGDAKMDQGTCKLRCHYYHVTGPEATTLMNKEHVRLLKLWQNQNKIFKTPTTRTFTEFNMDIDLSFLHPVQELVMVIRRAKDVGNTSLIGTAAPKNVEQDAREKNFFAYHGSGYDPNPDNWYNQGNTKDQNAQTNAQSFAVKVDGFKLTLNGQERHPSLTNLSRKYLMERLMPLLHSNTSTMHRDACHGSSGDVPALHSEHGLSENYCDGGSHRHMECLKGALDRKEIYIYPFAIAPENTNPSGAVNFSKVSHARLEIKARVKSLQPTAATDFQVDIWGVNYNWLQIKDGRALTSFA